MTLSALNHFLDPVLIAPYRMTLALGGNALAAFLAGTIVLSLLATLVGELTMAGIYWLNRKHLASLNKKMVTHNNLSIKALAFKDKPSYSACNKIANEYFGRNLFAGFTLFASSLWPAFFALAWLSFRFRDTTIPIMDLELQYQAVFIPIYVIMRIAFGLTKKRIWPFNRFVAFRVRNEDCGEKLLTWGDVDRERQAAAQLREDAGRPQI